MSIKQYGIIVTESMVVIWDNDPYTVKMIPMKLEAKEFVLIPVHTVVKKPSTIFRFHGVR
ncbi:MAG: hypothetical protein IPO33_18025 [Saprospiraceae bacterium]|nr:hypothetical protein [Candidatus Brachybacter algidus]